MPFAHIWITDSLNTLNALAFRERCGFADGLDGGLDVLLRVERPDTKSDGTTDLGGSKLLVDQGGAVKASSAGDVRVNVQQRSHISSARSRP